MVKHPCPVVKRIVLPFDVRFSIVNERAGIFEQVKQAGSLNASTLPAWKPAGADASFQSIRSAQTEQLRRFWDSLWSIR